MTQHSFLRNDGGFFPVQATDIALSTTTSTGFLSFVTSTTTAVFSLSSTATTFDIAFVAQGSTGVWLATAYWSVSDTATINQTNFKLWDGTTVIACGVTRVGAATGFSNGSVTGFITNPSGNIKLSAVCNSATGQINAGTINIVGTSPLWTPNTAVTAIRIG